MCAIISLRVIIQDCLKHLDKDIDLTLSSLYALSALNLIRVEVQ